MSNHRQMSIVISVLTIRERRVSQLILFRFGAIDKTIQISESRFLVLNLAIVPFRYLLVFLCKKTGYHRRWMAGFNCHDFLNNFGCVTLDDFCTNGFT